MISNETSGACPSALGPPRRNCYFFGKELGVYHFELESGYFNSKRWMLNRLVTGHGVVCGLDVQEAWEGDERGIRVDAGLAIDGYGREIVVDAPRVILDERLLPPNAEDYPDNAGEEPDDRGGYERQYESEKPRPRQPDRRRDECDDEDRCYHVLLCYHECKADPAPAHTGGCHHESSHPGTIVERYRIELREGPVPDELRPAGLCMPDCISDGNLNYRALVEHVSSGCPDCPCDPCVPLAEITVPAATGKNSCPRLEIDIAVRPLVFTNDLLYQLLLCHLSEAKQRRTK